MSKTTGHFDLTEINKWIGVEQQIDWNKTWLGEQPIEKSEIRRYALCNEDYNPLWFDEEYAKKTRYKGIIAPPTFPEMLGGRHVQHVAKIPGASEFPAGGLYLGDEFECFLPIRVGDKIKPSAKLVEVTEKVGKTVGPFVLLVVERKYANQNGQTVCIMRSKSISFSVERAPKEGLYSNIKLERVNPEFLSLVKGELRARGTKPLYYEDVEIGSAVPPLKRMLTLPRLIGQAACERVGIALPHNTHNLGCFWHYIESESLRLRAMPAPFDYGNIRCSWLSQVITDWIGDDGWLRKLDFRVPRPMFLNDTTTISGKVTNKYIKDGEHFVDCQLSGENQRGEISTEATATVILPSCK